MEAKGFALEDAADWFLDHLKVERAASPHTVAGYRNDLWVAANFFRELGIGDWQELNPALLLRYQSSLGPPLANATAQRRMSALRSMLKFLKRERKGPVSDLPSGMGIKKAKLLPKALSFEALELLLAAPDISKSKGLRDRALLELIYGGGLRVSEATTVTLNEVDRNEGAIRLTGKRGKTRWVPLPSQTKSWLERYLAEARPKLLKRPSSLVFISDQGKPMLRQTVYKLLDRYARLAGVQYHVSPHTLRHTYAVHLLKGGADLRAVQELLGHESIATTQIYTYLDLDEVQKKYRTAHPRG